VTVVFIISLLILVVAAASGVTYALARQAFSRSLAEMSETMRQQVNSLRTSLSTLQMEVADLQKAAGARQEVSFGAPSTSVSTAAPAPVRRDVTTHEPPEVSHEEISPETLVMIAAAVTSFLGKRVRIRSAKMLQSPYEIVNPWAQQGRVFVQASHNVRSRG